MKMTVVLAAAALAVPALAAPQAAPTKPAAAPPAWEKRVVLTADGGFLVGNPAAKAKLVEYGSLSCPVCQNFHALSWQPINDRVATGQLSFEFRPFPVHSADPILHALLRCAGPANFLRFANDFYDNQPTLALAYEQWATANPTTNPNATPASRVKYATAWGFVDFAATHGLTRARATACVSDTKTMQANADRDAKAAKALALRGTPTLFLNGQPLPLTDWGTMEQAIIAITG